MACLVGASPARLPATMALNWLCGLCSTNPRFLVTTQVASPSFTRLTANSLSSSMYAYLDIFMRVSSYVTSILATLGR